MVLPMEMQAWVAEGALAQSARRSIRACGSNRCEADGRLLSAEASRIPAPAETLRANGERGIRLSSRLSPSWSQSYYPTFSASEESPLPQPLGLPVYKSSHPSAQGLFSLNRESKADCTRGKRMTYDPGEEL